MSPRHDETQAFLEAASIPTRRAFACDCADRILQRYEERFGHAVPERDLIVDVILRVRLGDVGDAPDSSTTPRGTRRPRDLATTLALALSNTAQAWEIAQLLPELCATTDDADDERRWMRQHTSTQPCRARSRPCSRPTLPNVTRNLRAIPPNGKNRGR